MERAFQNRKYACEYPYFPKHCSQETADWDGYITILSTSTGTPIDDSAIWLESIGRPTMPLAINPSLIQSAAGTRIGMGRKHPNNFVQAICMDP